MSYTSIVDGNFPSIVLRSGSVPVNFQRLVCYAVYSKSVFFPFLYSQFTFCVGILRSTFLSTTHNSVVNCCTCFNHVYSISPMRPFRRLLFARNSWFFLKNDQECKSKMYYYCTVFLYGVGIGKHFCVSSLRTGPIKNSLGSF